MENNMLHSTLHGDRTDRPPILIAHGLFGSARNWGVIAKRLSADRQVIAVDMRNHGNSRWDATHGYIDLAEDLAMVLDHLGEVLGQVGIAVGGVPTAVAVVAHVHRDHLPVSA